MSARLVPVFTSLRVAWQAWFQEECFDWRPAAASLVGGVLVWPLVHRLPMVGWDWYYWFFANRIEFYPPWTSLLLSPLVQLPWRAGLSLVNSLLLVALAVFVYRQALGEAIPTRLLACAMALLTPQVFINLYLGSIEGLMLIGMLLLPPGAALVLFKPNLTGWVLLARRQWFIWGAGIGVISLVIWGWWPANMFSWIEPLTEKSLAIGWYNLGWPIAVLGAVLLPFSGANPMRLLAAGLLLTPYLMPNHLYLLLPALGSVRGWKRAALWAAAWISGLAAGAYGSSLMRLAILFPLAVWLLIPARERWLPVDVEKTQS